MEAKSQSGHNRSDFFCFPGNHSKVHTPWKKCTPPDLSWKGSRRKIQAGSGTTTFQSSQSLLSFNGIHKARKMGLSTKRNCTPFDTLWYQNRCAVLKIVTYFNTKCTPLEVIVKRYGFRSKVQKSRFTKIYQFHFLPIYAHSLFLPVVLTFLLFWGYSMVKKGGHTMEKEDALKEIKYELGKFIFKLWYCQD